MKLTILDYGAGNVESVFNALKTVSSNNSIEIVVSNKVSDLKSSSYFLLPGVGAFGDCMQGLRNIEGFVLELRNQVLNFKKPFLAICVGMQVLASVGFENGEHQGLNFINGRVEKIIEPNLKVPHMGWNNLIIKNNKHPILKNIHNGTDFYFANSFHFTCQNENNLLAHVEYGNTKITAVVAKDNIIGAQFHPEKSGEIGLQFLNNFLNWRP